MPEPPHRCNHTGKPGFHLRALRQIAVQCERTSDPTTRAGAISRIIRYKSEICLDRALGYSRFMRQQSKEGEVMKRARIVPLVVGLLGVGFSGAAMAGVNVGVNIGVPAPVYVAPAPVYVAPAPVYAPPPPVYAPPPPVYAPAPVYYGGPSIVIGWHNDRYWDGRRWWGRDEWYRHHGDWGRGHDRGEHRGWRR